MSTSYYRLASPVTFLKLDSGKGGHARLNIWVNQGLAGTLTLRKEETRDTVSLFRSHKCALRTYYGGCDLGTVVTIPHPTLPDEAVVISEYGELMTVAQVKAKRGAGKRSDEDVAELFDGGQ